MGAGPIKRSGSGSGAEGTTVSNFKRLYLDGGCYFFTLVTHQRRRWLATPEARHRLREAIAHVRKRYSLTMDAIVLLPDHLHCIWRLPRGDSDFSTRWRLIKHHVSRSQTLREHAPLWQPRFWEHAIRDEKDWRIHMDYIHFNPVKHGLVKSPGDWPYSSFNRAVEKGLYEPEWGNNVPTSLREKDLE